MLGTEKTVYRLAHCVWCAPGCNSLCPLTASNEAHDKESKISTNAWQVTVWMCWVVLWLFKNSKHKKRDSPTFGCPNLLFPKMLFKRGKTTWYIALKKNITEGLWVFQLCWMMLSLQTSISCSTIPNDIYFWIWLLPVPWFTPQNPQTDFSAI